MTTSTTRAGGQAPAAIYVPEWANVAVALSMFANILALVFVSLPVIGFFVISFNGFSEGNPTSLGTKAIWSLVILVFAVLPIASIYFSRRFLRRGLVAAAIIAGWIVPVIGGGLYAAYGIHHLIPAAAAPAPAALSPPPAEGVAP